MFGPWRALAAYVAVLGSYLLSLAYAHRANPLSSFDRSGGFRYPLSDGLRNRTLEAVSAGQPEDRLPSSSSAKICIGVPTRARSGNIDYLSAALTSLVAELSPAQRSELHIALYLIDGHSALDQAESSGLIGRLADSGATADSRTTALTSWLAKQQAGPLSQSRSRHGPFIHDFLAGLDQCLEHTAADHILWMEDDLIARPDWYQILQTEILSQLRDDSTWLFIMLFSSETFMYWASEDAWLLIAHMLYPLLALSLASLGVFVYRTLPKRPDSYADSSAKSVPSLTPAAHRRMLTQHVAYTVAAALLLAPFVGLHLSRGKFALYPLEPGLTLKTGRECCMQSVLFSRDSARQVLAEFVDIIDGVGRSVDYNVKGQDAILFDLGAAGSRRGYKYTPSLFQHVGDMSTYVQSSGKPRLRSWNFELGLREAARAS